MPDEIREWELDPMGYVIVRLLDDKGQVASTHRCRRPRLREYRELRNDLEAITREANDKRNELAELQKQLEDPDSDVDSINQELADALDWLAERSVPWIQRAFDMLADRPLPEPDEWPPFLVSQEIPLQMVRHWRSVPLASGKAGTNSP